MPFASRPLQHFDGVSRRYRYYVLALLILVYVINFVDRQVLSVLIEPIKRDLQLSDTQLGLLSGLAFALFYVTFGIPVARLADRASRRNLIATCMILWSAMTSMGALASSFSQLLAARIGVAIGEAGCVAPSHSLLSDYFRPEHRAAVLSLYSAGAAVGIFAGLLGGGWLAELFGWRIALVCIGLPGVAVALLLLLTLREPARGMSLPSAHARPAQAQPARGSLIPDLVSLLRRRALLYAALAGGFQSMVTYGMASWLPSFFMRVHEMSAASAGTTLALINGLVSGVGAIVGGSLATVMARRDRRWLLWVPALSTAIATPMYVVALAADSTTLSVLALVPAAFTGLMYVGPSLAAIHGVAGVTLRATGVALTLFVSNLLGIGGGALLVGAVSDALAASGSVTSLRYGLLVVLLANIPAMLGYVLAARTLDRDWRE